MFNFTMKNLAHNAVQDTHKFGWLPTLWNNNEHRQPLPDLNPLTPKTQTSI